MKDIISELISNGNKNKLIGNKIRRNTTIEYLTKILENMKKSFHEMLLKNNEIITEKNKMQLISKFMLKYNEQIDEISKHLIDKCLTSMTIENSRKWLTKYLPVSLKEIV